MTQEELKQITAQRERRTIEYKEAWSDLPGNLFETICAFLNRDGGVIVLGAHDDGTITNGVNPRAIDQMCKNIANISNNNEQLKPSFLLQPEIVDIEDSSFFASDKAQVIVIQVPASSQAHRFKNKFFDRSVDGDFELRTDAEISALYLRKSTQYTENTIYPYLRVEHFKEGIVNKARNLIHSMRENHPWLELSDMELFRQANLYRTDVSTGEEGFTLAALMLFGKDEIIQSALPYYKIDCVLRRVNTDRYDDRFTSYGNIIDGYSELMAFFERYFPDTFYMEGDQRVSLRNKVFREVVSNILIHREYLNPSISLIDIRRDYVLIQNANRPLRAGVITPDNYTPHPKNPHLAKFFVQMGRAEHLGTGVRNLYHYAPIYLGTEPTITDDDMFRIRLNIAESKRAELALSTTESATVSTTKSSGKGSGKGSGKSSGKSSGKVRGKSSGKTVEKRIGKTARKIIELMRENPKITIPEIAAIVDTSERNVEKHTSNLQKGGKIRRIDGNNGGHWEVIELEVSNIMSRHNTPKSSEKLG